MGLEMHRGRFLSLIFIAASLCGASPTASAATPSQPPCGANASPSISLDVPRGVAGGPLPADIYAYQNDAVDGDNGVVGGTITVNVYNASTTPAKLTQSIQVPAGKDPDSDDEENRIAGFVPQPLGARLRIAATYETSWTDYNADPTDDVACDQTVTTTTTVGRGLPPRLSFRHEHVQGSGEQLDLDLNPARGGCDNQLGGYTQRATAYLTETWSLGRKHWRMSVTPCYRGVRLHTPPDIFSFDGTAGSSNVDPGGYELWLSAIAPTNFHRARYKFVVAFNRHALYRGHMTTYYKYTPGYRVYQGTDAFINYCINGEHQTYSANLLLYCNHPSETVASVTLS